MKVTLACPSCDVPAATPIDHACDWQCRACDHRQHLDAVDPALSNCVVCGSHELYKKKDFPHALGMAILVVALILATIAYYAYEPWLCWAFLIGSAIIDGAMYLMVGDVVVCYRCEAHYRGLKPTDAHQPFEIAIGERYRQEKIRLEQAKSKVS